MKNRIDRIVAAVAVSSPNPNPNGIDQGLADILIHSLESDYWRQIDKIVETVMVANRLPRKIHLEPNWSGDRELLEIFRKMPAKKRDSQLDIIFRTIHFVSKNKTAILAKN